MPILFTYLVKLSLSLAVVYLFYRFVLYRLTFYNWNRWYLVVYSMLCFVIPFIDISPVLEDNNLVANPVINWVPLIGAGNKLPGSDSGVWTGWNVLSVMILAGIVIMGLRFCIQLYSFSRLRKKRVYLSGDKVKIYQLNEEIIPFSFGNAIYINCEQHTQEELKEIIRHEFVHVRQRHTFDIIWSEWLCLLTWFNPFSWLLRKAIRQNLEFIADNQVLVHGMDKKEYQYLLLKVMGQSPYSIATRFNFSSLKKRIAMMNKNKSARKQLLRMLFLLPATAVLLLAFRNYDHSPVKKGIKLSEMVAGRYVDTTAPTMAEFLKQHPEVEGISVQQNKNNGVATNTLVIKLKNGKSEKYNMNRKEEMDVVFSKYGFLPIPPPPPLPPPPPPPPAEDDKSVKVEGYREAPIVVAGYPLNDLKEVKVVQGYPLTVADTYNDNNGAAFTGTPAYFVDGKETSKEDVDKISPEDIATVNVFKGDMAVANYGKNYKEGVVAILTKKYAASVKTTEPATVVIAGTGTGNVSATSPAEVRVVQGYRTITDASAGQKLVILDGKEINAAEMTLKLKGNYNIVTLTPEEAVKKYGAKGKNGAMIIKTVQ